MSMRTWGGQIGDKATIDLLVWAATGAAAATALRKGPPILAFVTASEVECLNDVYEDVI